MADVVDSWPRRSPGSTASTASRACRIAINKQSGANTVGVAEAVRAEVEQINRDFPQARLVTLIDTSVYIRRSIANIGTPS